MTSKKRDAVSAPSTPHGCWHSTPAPTCSEEQAGPSCSLLIMCKNEWNYGIFMHVPLTCWIVLESLGCLKGNHFRKAHVFGNEIWGPFTLFLEPNLRLGAFTAACLKNVKLLGKSWKWNGFMIPINSSYGYLYIRILGPSLYQQAGSVVIWSHHSTLHYSGARMLQAPKHIQNTEVSRGTKHGLGGGSSRHHLFVKGIPSTSRTGGC